ncbi:hypothetical protein [Flavobacterium seoulense]|uniref:Uncharacterized protein n=1 Tax=Flavobacterium seoulense TaxID=1492738 RepID=A0A066WKX4_9FLAO|nr:hypothetical protein [Flavobacterium seoulense]KDN54667.1 hypothetical protein FEM21_21810 [Flavobacterium seoulense]
MQFLFQRRKKTAQSNEAVKPNGLSKIMEKGYYYAQSKWSEWMTKQTAKLSIRQQRLVFGFFVACTTSYSVYLIIQNFSNTDSNRITINPIVKPVNTFQTGYIAPTTKSTVSKIEFDRVVRFRVYIDSLTISPTGKRTLDSIKNKHPGLLDSLAAVENYYQSHLKKYNYGK